MFNIVQLLRVNMGQRLEVTLVEYGAAPENLAGMDL